MIITVLPWSSTVLEYPLFVIKDDLLGLRTGTKKVRTCVTAKCGVIHNCTQYSHKPVSYTHLRAHETSLHLVCRLLLEKTTATA